LNVPLIVIKANNTGLGYYTPVKLTGLRLMLEAETKDGDVLLFAPEELGAHPGCDDPFGCYLQVYTQGKYNDCSRCEDKNELQIQYIKRLKDMLKAFMDYLEKVVKEAIKGVY
jgi:hypothetical protein